MTEILESEEAMMLHLFRQNNELLDNKASENWKKWEGKVSGNQNAIKNALKALGREPSDVNELEKLLLKQARESLANVLKEADMDEAALNGSNIKSKL